MLQIYSDNEIRATEHVAYFKKQQIWRIEVADRLARFINDEDVLDIRTPQSELHISPAYLFILKNGDKVWSAGNRDWYKKEGK